MEIYQDVELGGDPRADPEQIDTFLLIYHPDPDKYWKMGGWMDCAIYTVNIARFNSKIVHLVNTCLTY